MLDRPLQILILEDDIGHTRIIERAFESDPQYQLTMTSRISEARSSLAAKDYDVIISDLVVPDGRGTELIGSELYHPPVIVMTSQGDEKTAVDAMKAGAFDYVVKTAPILLELPRFAERIFREWSLRNEKQRSDDALRESEARIRAIINLVPDLILVHSTNGHILQCEGNIGLLPVPKETILDQPMRSLVVEADLDLLQEACQRVLESGNPETVVFASSLKEPLYYRARLAKYGTSEVLSVLSDVTDEQEALSILERLSNREYEVMTHVMRGLPNKTIATEMGISIKTVETHRANLMKKLDVRSVAELATIALNSNALPQESGVG